MSAVSQHPSKSRSPGSATAPPGEIIAYLLKSLHHSLRQAVDETLRLHGMEMSFAHLATLYTLNAEPGVAGAELARRGFVTAQTMNTLLRRLEQEGDIERRPNPASLRADSWFITDSGLLHLDRAKVVGEGVFRRMLSPFKAGEIALLQSLLERCIGGLDVQVDDMRSKYKAASRNSKDTKPRGAVRKSTVKKKGR